MRKFNYKSWKPWLIFIIIVIILIIFLLLFTEDLDISDYFTAKPSAQVQVVG